MIVIHSPPSHKGRIDTWIWLQDPDYWNMLPYNSCQPPRVGHRESYCQVLPQGRGVEVQCQEKGATHGHLLKVYYSWNYTSCVVLNAFFTFLICMKFGRPWKVGMVYRALYYRGQTYGNRCPFFLHIDMLLLPETTSTPFIKRCGCPTSVLHP